jgi:hypothetical protein
LFALTLVVREVQHVDLAQVVFDAVTAFAGDAELAPQ